MLAALIIVFREVMEAGLIVGIVAAVTRGVPGARLFISGGVAIGVAGATLLAVFAGAMANAIQGIGQELFNAGVLGLAVVMLAWHNIWMASHGREMAAELKSAGQAVKTGSATLFSLGAVVAIAVLREGSEVVLFLYGVFASGQENVLSVASGGVMGLLAGALLGWLSYAGLVRIPPRYIFSFTGGLITLLASGLAAQATAFLEQAGLINTLSDTAWDTSAYLSESSIPGRMLHVLIGYSEAPTRMELVAYLVTLVTITLAARLVNSQHRVGRLRAAAAE